ncbi:MAG: hypothetical protein ACYC9Q_01820 [Bacillota bacterium]
MTHSLHRRGSAESLQDDYVILATPAAGVNHEGSKDKLRRILDIIYELEPVNIGSYECGTILTGATLDEIKAKLAEVPRVRCVFSDRAKIKELVRQIKDLDLGVSITLSGLTEEVVGLAGELGLEPHSINFSLDIWGKKEALPSEEVLEFVTMCGHGMVSRHLVERLIDQVKRGRRTPHQAAILVAQPCVCGIFNVDRAERLFERFTPVIGLASGAGLADRGD